MSTQIGSAYGLIDIRTGNAYSNILGLDTALGTLGRSMLGLNPITLALGGTLIGLGAGIGAVAGTIASGVKAADKLEVILDGVQANMQITNEETAKLKELVSDLGIDPNLKVSSFEAAEAIEMLGRNGLNVQDILDGAARNTVLLANATGGTFSQSADIATDVMSLFGIAAKDMGQAVDGITSVVNNSKFSINDYALALAQGGGVAAGVGVSFEDFNTSIAGIAQYFASGSDAGTSFKTFLQRLIPQSKKAKGVMQELGIITEDGRNQFFDASGQMRDMADIAGILQGALGGLSEEARNEALTELFGTDAMRAALGLMEQGYQGFVDLRRAMQETDAAAAAAIRMDNLTGDMEILQGVLETLKIAIGDEFLPIFRQGAQSLTAFVTANQDKVLGFFSGLADIVADALPVIRDFAQQGIEYLSGLFDGLFEAYRQGGLEGLVSEIASYLGQAASDVWDKLFGADDGTISSGVDGIIDSVTSYLETKWPELQGLLQGYADKFWLWLLGDGQNEGALQRFNDVLQDLLKRIEEWTNDPATQERLSRLGESIGNAMVDGIELVVSNADEIAKVLQKLIEATAKAAGILAPQFVTIGKSIAGGVLSGMIESITGAEVGEALKNALGQLWTQSLAAALPGPLGAALSLYNNPLFTQDTTPLPEFSTQDSTRQTELLEQLNGKIEGQSVILVNKEGLRDSGFVTVEDLQ